MDKKEAKKYFLIMCLLVVLYLSYKIIQPYITAILGALILAYIFFPLFRKLKEKTNKPELSSILTCLIIVLLILIPILIISNILIQESIGLYQSDFIKNIELFTEKYTSEDFPYSGLVSQAIFKGLEYIQTGATNIFIALPSGIFGFLIAIYTLYFLLINGELLTKKIKSIIPLKEKESLLNNIGKTTYSIVYGLFAVAVIEIIISAIGFSILGLSSPIMWSLVIGFLALIPFIGPTFVWVPFTIIELLLDNTWVAIGLIITGIILSVVDTFLRAKLIGEKSQMSPAIVLIGLLGGLKVFGFTGLILGPVVLSTLIEIIKLYQEEKFITEK